MTADAPTLLQRIVLRDAEAARWMVFTDPVDVLTAADTEVIAVLEEAERRVRDDRLYAAGFVSYEAAPAFDTAFITHAPAGLPPIVLGLFRKPQFVAELPPPPEARRAAGDWCLSERREDYVQKIASIKDEIAAGNTYQVNYTVRRYSKNVANAWDFFLHVASDAPYAAYIESGGFAIVSASPELFFVLDDERLTCKPMKGTAARGMTRHEDDANRDRLGQSVKDRAENVMIADMVRNDLGRVAAAGSVRAAALCEVEKYRTVWQMTSTVTAETRASLAGIFRALFPCASVTGAPKVASMKLIAELEDSARGIYTGAIGYLAPQRQACFSVAIRTALIDTRTAAATYGVGGGIVWDSDPDAEYQECLDKMKILSGGAGERDFALLETLLWTPGEGYFLLDEHLERLADSAAYFDFPCDREVVAQRLRERAISEHPVRVRLLVYRDGRIVLSPSPLPPTRETLLLGVASEAVDAANPFLYHKTTARGVYERALAGAGHCDDVLLWNTQGEVTESTIANLVVSLGGQLFTPPIACGLLAGTFRRKLLSDGKVEERIIRLDDLAAAEALFLVNSVRGWMPCRLAGTRRPRAHDDQGALPVRAAQRRAK